MDGNSRAVAGGRSRKPLRLLAHTTAADEFMSETLPAYL